MIAGGTGSAEVQHANNDGNEVSEIQGEDQATSAESTEGQTNQTTPTPLDGATTEATPANGEITTEDTPEDRKPRDVSLGNLWEPHVHSGQIWQCAGRKYSDRTFSPWQDRCVSCMKREGGTRIAAAHNHFP